METLEKQFRELTRAAFARYGFAYAELLRRWPVMAGEELAAVCRPERIRWPRGANGSGATRDGTLVVRALHGHALHVQHESARIIERINAYYGYAAIGSIKILQGNLPKDARSASAAASPERPTPQALLDRLECISDERLRSALTSLGRNVAASQSKAKD